MIGLWKIDDSFRLLSDFPYFLMRKFRNCKPNYPIPTGGGDPGVIKDLEVRNQRLSTAYNIALTQVGVLNKKYKALQTEHAALAARLRP
jgi:hypothetical protein